ncbi:hypothetical protein, partial [Streptococcus agalactiae]
RPIVITIVKEKTSWINIPVCLQSESSRNNLLDFLLRKLTSCQLIKNIVFYLHCHWIMSIVW